MLGESYGAAIDVRLLAGLAYVNAASGLSWTISWSDRHRRRLPGGSRCPRRRRPHNLRNFGMNPGPRIRIGPNILPVVSVPSRISWRTKAGGSPLQPVGLLLDGHERAQQVHAGLGARVSFHRHPRLRAGY
jgi:hypothetical protein